MVAERPWYIPRKCDASFLLSGVWGCTLRLRCAARFVLRIILTLAKEGRHYASGRVILTKTIFVDVERRISKRRSPISRICPCEGMLGWWHKM